MRKQLLCRPRGGLNDILNRIYHCWRYANRFDRELWVDTTRSGFRDCFSHYFAATPEMNFGIPEGVTERSCFPREVEGQISSYESSYQDEFGNYAKLPSGPRLTFAFGRDYAEGLLLHEQCGGGRRGIRVLRFLSLNEQISSGIKKKVEALGDYIAIHVRHSDYKTDYRGFFEKIKGRVGSSPVVLCTDSHECQVYARSIFPNIEMSSQVPDTRGQPLHDNPAVTCFEANVRALTDLIVLVCARDFLCVKTEGNLLSGFAVLAHRLRGKGLSNRAWALLHGEVSFLEEIKSRPRRGLMNRSRRTMPTSHDN